jgi:hypothetical protein
MSRHSFMLAVLATLFFSLPLAAAPVVVSGGISFGTTSTTDTPGGALAVNDLISVTGGAVSSRSGDFTAVLPATPLTITNFNLTMTTAFGFTSGFGSFAGTISLVDIVVEGPGLRVANVFASGTFTPAGPLSGFLPNTLTLLTFSITEAGGQNNSSGTMSAPPPGPDPGVIPVPMSILLMGVGLVGLGAIMRRHTA